MSHLHDESHSRNSAILHSYTRARAGPFPEHNMRSLVTAGQIRVLVLDTNRLPLSLQILWDGAL
jgi:hypothetical protein